jgi:hypothetical protein
MKTILATTVAAMVGAIAFALPPAPAREFPSDESTTRDEAVSQKARNLWVKTKAYLSEEPPTYKEGAQQTLVDLGREIDTVSMRVGVHPPEYFQTRLRSLREQHDDLISKLNDLNGEAIKVRMSGPRYVFDQRVSLLEYSLDQAEAEADILARLNRSEIRDLPQ